MCIRDRLGNELPADFVFCVARSDLSVVLRFTFVPRLESLSWTPNNRVLFVERGTRGRVEIDLGTCAAKLVKGSISSDFEATPSPFECRGVRYSRVSAEVQARKRAIRYYNLRTP